MQSVKWQKCCQHRGFSPASPFFLHRGNTCLCEGVESSYSNSKILPGKERQQDLSEKILCSLDRRGTYQCQKSGQRARINLTITSGDNMHCPAIANRLFFRVFPYQLRNFNLSQSSLQMDILNRYVESVIVLEINHVGKFRTSRPLNFPREKLVIKFLKGRLNIHITEIYFD